MHMQQECFLYYLSLRGGVRLVSDRGWPLPSPPDMNGTDRKTLCKLHQASLESVSNKGALRRRNFTLTFQSSKSCTCCEFHHAGVTCAESPGMH